MEQCVQQETHHYDGLVFAKLIHKETRDRGTKERREGQRQINDGDLFDRYSDTLHMDGQIREQGRSGTVHNEQCDLQHDQIGIDAVPNA